MITPGFTAGTQRRVLALAGVAGVVLAHVMAYVLAYPDPAARAAELHATGHGYWPLAVGMAAVSMAAALALTVARGVRGRVAVHASWPRRLAALVGWQVVLFFAVEAIERAGSGVSPGSLFHSRAFAIGLAVQVVVAVGALVVLALIERGAEWLGARGRAAARRAVAPLAAPVASWHSADPRTPRRARAPPLLST